MPDLSFQVAKVEPAHGAVTPALVFELRIAAASPSDQVEALMLNAQIHIQCPQRS
jgi:hypothetical protein